MIELDARNYYDFSTGISYEFGSKDFNGIEGDEIRNVKVISGAGVFQSFGPGAMKVLAECRRRAGQNIPTETP